MKQRVVEGLCLGVTAFAIVGCGSSGGGSASPTPTPARTASYLSAVRPLYPDTNTDGDLVRTGKTVCAALDAGASYDDALAALSVLPEGKAKIQATAAVRYLCPKHIDELPG